MSLAARITLLILAALLPFLALEGYSQYTLRRDRVAEVHAQALRTTELIGRNLTTVVENTRALLASIARLVPLTEADASVCNRLAALLPTYPQFRNIAVVEDSGRALCTTARALPAGGVSLADRPYMQEAAASRDFVFAPYMTSPVSGAPIMPSVYPIVGRDGSIEGYVIVTVDLDWLSRSIVTPLPEKSAAVVANRAGTIIAHSDAPERWLGRQVAPEILPLIGGSKHGSVDLHGPDGATIVSYVNLPYGLFVATQLHAPALLSDVDAATYRELALALAAILAAMLASIAVGHRLITRPLRGIAGVVRRWTEGDLTARIATDASRSDLSAVGHGLNAMIGRLESREVELKRLNETLEERVAEQTQALRTEIEARREVEATLQHSRRLEAIGQLTGGVAHDFNNLLTVIRGAVDFLDRRLKAGESDVTRYTGAIRQSVERAASLTQRLLAFARRQPLAPKPTDVNRLVVGMSEMLRRTLDENVEIQTELAPGLRRIAVDVNQLETAILNIAVNARDAMPEGGKLTIRTDNIFLDGSFAAANAELAPGRYVKITLADTGVGMDQEQAARAFEPFFTTKEFGAGTGLGLSQVHGFVMQSRGHVGIDSQPGRGTTVSLYFPSLDAGEAIDPAAPATAAAPVLGGSETILVVEDDASVRAFTTEILEGLGYSVLIAADGPSALELLEREPAIALLFTDVGLPKSMNGRQLAEEARRRRPALKVLFTTGYARQALMQDGRIEPGIVVLPKPFTDADVARKVRGVLDSRQRADTAVPLNTGRD